MVPEQLSMIEWYSPTLLLKAGVAVVVSTLFGQHADQRTMEALSGPACFFDYSSGELPVRKMDGELNEAEEYVNGREGFWFDYVADVGDGWNSTCSVANALTRPRLSMTRDQEKYGTSIADADSSKV